MMTIENAPEQTGRRTPLFRLKTNKPERLAEVALEIFTARGYKQTRIEDVARQLGLSKSAVFFHFASKDALLRGTVDRFCLDGLSALPRPSLTDELRALLAEGRPRQILEMVVGITSEVPGIGDHYRTCMLARLAPRNGAEAARVALDAVLAEVAFEAIFRNAAPAPQADGGEQA